MTFSSKLQKLRKDNNLSQEELARELNVSRQAISKWELGTLPDTNNLVKLSQYFDCTIDFLINDSIINDVKSVNSDKTSKLREKPDLIVLISCCCFVISIFILVIINICSIINPAPIVRQASDGSWYVGVIGFIDFYNLYGLIFLAFSGAFLSFSIIILHQLHKESPQKNIIKKEIYRVLCGFFVMILYGVFVFYEIMTAPYIFTEITETIVAIGINIIGIGLILTGFQKKKGM